MTRDQPHGGAQLLVVEVVQQDGAGPGGQGCVQRSEVADLELYADDVTGGRFAAHANGSYGRRQPSGRQAIYRRLSDNSADVLAYDLGVEVTAEDVEGIQAEASAAIGEHDAVRLPVMADRLQLIPLRCGGSQG